MSSNLHLSPLLVAALLGATPSAFAQNVGPSTSVAPYLLPSRPGVTTTSMLTVADPTSTIGGYRMVGLPDGMGAFDGPGSKLTLVIGHEISGAAGIVRANGQTGAFVSRWEIEKSTLAVTSGRDTAQAPSDVNWSSQAPRPVSRFCSGDLALPGAYKFGALGTDARIFLNGEEAGSEGTAWAHVLTGPGTNGSWELPALGRFSWENAVASSWPQARTVVIGLDDSSPGQVYVYVGTKVNSGNDVERAGLTNGVLYGIRVPGIPTETRPVVINSTFELAPLGSQVGVTGAFLDGASVAAGVTNFLRPEDGCWDTRPGFEKDFYFVTTDTLTTNNGRSRLYRLTFKDLAVPELGGTITTLLVGTEGGEMFDNMCIDGLGRIFIQEDVGNNARLGRVWLYDTASGGFGEVARHTASYFVTGGANFITQDEESSGIFDAASLLGQGWFLLNVQAHKSLGGELVENGQLLALYVDPQLRQPAGVSTYGASSAGCGGSLAIAAQAIPAVGNAAFGLRCSRAPESGNGAFLLGSAGLTTPISVLNVDVWVDPIAQPFVTVPVTSTAAGLGTIALPIPAGASVGLDLFTQFVWVGPSAPPPCPPFGISASNAAKVTIQP